MNDQKHSNLSNYDNPIPKPPDEMFDDFLKNMEERLITRRFDRDRRRNGKPVSGRTETQ